MFHRSSSITTLVFALSWHGLVDIAASTKDLEWQWYPAAGFAREYDGDEDEVISSIMQSSVSIPFQNFVNPPVASPRKRRFAHAQRLVLLGEESHDTRTHRDVSLRSTAAKKGSINVGTSSSSVASQGTSASAGAAVDASNSAVSQAIGNQVSVGQGSGASASRGQANGTVTAATAETGAANVTDQSAVQASGQNAVAAKQPIATQSWFSFLRFTFSFAFVVKALCMMCNIFYQASPLPLISEFKAKGDTGDADLAPFVATAYGGWQWCFYGLFAYIVTQKSGFLVLVYSNVVGATLGLYYVYAFYLNCKNMAMLQKAPKYYLVLGTLVLVQFVAIMSLKPVSALFFSGLVSSVWSTIGSLALISSVSTVYETQSSKSLPLPLLVVGEISALLWIVCGVVLWDPWITFPNCFSMVVCTFALHLCWKFPPKDALEVAEAEASDSDMVASVFMEPRDDCNDLNVRASPLQRALAYVRSASNDEIHTLQDHATTSNCYGSAPQTGGTGESF